MPPSVVMAREKARSWARAWGRVAFLGDDWRCPGCDSERRRDNDAFHDLGRNEHVFPPDPTFTGMGADLDVKVPIFWIAWKQARAADKPIGAFV